MESSGIVTGNATWRSYHLFRAEPWEEFLCTVVQPLVDQFADGGLTEGFFFIRYWERGPHIRLRLKTAYAEDVHRRVYAHFGDYFAQAPSRREAGADDWLPNDTVQEIAYEPETVRYGGPARLPIAERQFEVSSRAVLGVIGEGGDWSYDRALGAAIQLHLMFVHAFGFELEALKRFFAETADLLMSWENPLVQWRYDPKTLVPQFAEAFARQRAALVRAHALVWSALADGETFEQEWANRWVRGMREIAGCLTATRRAGEPLVNFTERAVLRSLIHMTNNRLGVRNRDEAYLAYVMKCALEEIDGRDG
jgi:thiopeptide-type bacteriocin biosynthesis protein